MSLNPRYFKEHTPAQMPAPQLTFDAVQPTTLTAKAGANPTVDTTAETLKAGNAQPSGGNPLTNLDLTALQVSKADFRAGMNYTADTSQIPGQFDPLQTIALHTVASGPVQSLTGADTLTPNLFTIAGPNSPLTSPFPTTVDQLASTGFILATGGTPPTQTPTPQPVTPPAPKPAPKNDDGGGILGAFKHGVDWVENKAGDAFHSAANTVKDVPVVGTVANGMADLFTNQVQFVGGVAKGAGDLVDGLGQMVAHPIRTVEGLGQIAAHIPGLVPGQPITPDSLKSDWHFFGNMLSAIVKPYKESMDAGKPSEALGHLVFDIATIVGTDGAGAAVDGVADAGKVSEVVSTAEKGADAANAAGKAGEIGLDVSKFTVDGVLDFGADTKAADAWGHAAFADWVKTLTPSELDALRTYTGGSYGEINSTLRGTPQLVTHSQAEVDQIIKDMDSGLNKAHLPTDTTVYRYNDGSYAQQLQDAFKNGNLKPGDIIPQDSYVSTTVTTGSTAESTFGNSVKWTIDVPQGSHAAYVESFTQVTGEQELLLQRGGSLKVVDVHMNGGSLEVKAVWQPPVP